MPSALVTQSGKQRTRRRLRARESSVRRTWVPPAQALFRPVFRELDIGNDPLPGIASG